MNFFSPFAITIYAIVALSLLGLPIGLSMISGSIVYLLVAKQDMGIAAEQLLQGLFNGYTLLAIPLFILAADLMNAGSLSDRLLKFCLALVGRFRGGLGHVNVVANIILSGMSGSAVADAAGLGKLIINLMMRDGKYSAGYAGALTAAASTIGPIIPPSIPLVLYSLVSDTSVGYLFLGGVVPGLIMGLVLMIMNAILAHRRGFPVERATPLREFPAITFEALPALMMPVVLLGGIYGGVMTPTEAAALAALYAYLISVLFYRSISLRQTFECLLSAARSSAAVGMLIAGALVFNYVVTREDLPNALSALLAGYHMTPTLFLLVVNLLLLLLGCLLDASTILLVIVPILIPTAKALHIDMVHFGLVVVVNLMIGLLTPPYGLLLFIVSNFTKQPLRVIVREAIPFILMLILALFIITYVPDAVLWLPRLFQYKG
jgi:tripartite ATP-independent transporter DctM subunit